MGSKVYETPFEYFRRRWERHRFTVDAFASDANALVRPCANEEEWGEIEGIVDTCCARFAGRYYTAETDGLAAEHYRSGDAVWANPPYDHTILKAVKLARELSQDAGVLWDMLLPVSGKTRWFDLIWNDAAGHWRDGVEAHYVGRVQFLIDGKLPLDKQGRPQSSRQENLQVTFHRGGEAWR